MGPLLRFRSSSIAVPVFVQQHHIIISSCILRSAAICGSGGPCAIPFTSAKRQNHQPNTYHPCKTLQHNPVQMSFTWHRLQPRRAQVGIQNGRDR
mmetsp:Transcript_4815/g.7927  ORF Transcript_4815/g.7927 Transcript_4815/m.7927 type:complete len:95 (-) Transcript_4815:1162-1446(-)